ncbi:MAG TPA: FAD/NAD(P)-binding protein, partial [Oscillatoriaceae cyanobacterium]
MPDIPTLLIVGGGFSGTMVAAHVLRLASSPIHVRLIERGPQVGRGIAYGTRESHHLLNVPANRISALPEEPAHFLHWLRRQDPSLEEATFAPRPTFAAYVTSILEEAIARKRPGVELSIVRGEAVSLRLESDAAVVTLDGGETLSGQRVVLALGNFPPALPGIPGLADSGGVVCDPWSPGALAELDPNAPVLTIGTGLTMVDMALTLRARGHRGTLHAVSRHGLLPRGYLPLQDYAPFLTPSPSLDAMMRQVRAEVRRAQAQGIHWQAVIDALRPAQQALWQGLPHAERKRFLRHLRPYWEVQRHRMAPPVAEAIAAMQAEGQLVLHAGRILGVSEAAEGLSVRVRPRGTSDERTLDVARILNCTGPADVRHVDHPLLRDLFVQGLVRPDALALGLDTAFH